MNKYISIENVSMRFPTKNGVFEALREINLGIEEGEFVSLIGHSGCGKSTLLNLIAGLTLPSEGFLICNGREIAGPGPDRGVVFQNHSLLPWLTCFENVHLAVERVFGADEKKAQLEERTHAALKLVGLTHATHKHPKEISGGMKQRVGIARAIVLNPTYLFCDEPNSGLDPKTSIVIDELIKDITIENNITTIINTHDMNSVMEIGENIVFIHDGYLEWNGSRNQVLDSTNMRLQEFIFASPFLQRLRKAALNNH